MQRSDRHRMIIRTVGRGPRTVTELAARAGVSGVTIRRDLAELAEVGLVQREHGGARAAAPRGAEYPFALRRDESNPAKKAIATAAAELVEAGAAVAFDNGTTALAVAEAVARHAGPGKQTNTDAQIGITALALSLHAAAALAANRANQVIVPGGVLEPDDLSFTSATAVATVQEMRFDTAFISACAADPAVGLTVANWADAQVKKALLSATRRVVLVATPDKFSRVAAHRFGTFADLDTIVTTNEIPFLTRHAVEENGVQLITVD